MFQFPSNGKAYPKMTTAEINDFVAKQFQFPSNGKAYPKFCYQFIGFGTRCCVSIPFKRESISKGVKQGRTLTRTTQFQFPSNGKAYPKSKNWAEEDCDALCFNSLQTGKHIQRHVLNLLIQAIPSFNSLQTGKHIQRENHPSILSFIFVEFQFPSNGKAYPK